MSLFEKIKNKRYDLQEAIDDKGNITPEPGDKAIEKSIVRRQRKINKKESKNQNRNIRNNKQEGDKLLQDINKRKSADLTRADAFRRAYGTSGSTEGAGGANTDTKPVKTTKPTVQAAQGRTKRLVKITGNVDSKKAEQYTKKINAANPKRPEYVKKDVYKGAEEITKKINPKQSRPLGQLVKKTKPSNTSVSGKLTPGQIDFSKSAELASKRKARINPKTGKATQAGVKDFAMNRGGFGRRSANMSQADFKKMVTSDPKTAKSFKKIVTDAERIASNPQSRAYKDIERKINTSDYAGKEARKRPAGSKTYAQVKREIDAKEKAYQTKTLPKQKKLAKKFLVNPKKVEALTQQIGPRNQAFKQAATRFASKVPGGKSSLVRKGIKFASKLGPAGRIASVAALPLLAPGVRQTARKVALTGLAGAGLIASRKKPVKPKTFVNVSLSIGDHSTAVAFIATITNMVVKTLAKNPETTT